MNINEKQLTQIIKQCIMENYSKKPDYTIAIDFDGTVVKHEYPQVGEDIGAVPILKKLVENGAGLILSTMRDEESGTLQDAVNWFEENDIPLYGINKHPAQESWTQSPKCHANFCIDDRNFGTPLTKDEEGNVFVNWEKMEKMLKQGNFID